MSPFWKGFFSVFDIGPRRIKYKATEEFKWYHDGPWWEHPIYKKKDRD